MREVFSIKRYHIIVCECVEVILTVFVKANGGLMSAKCVLVWNGYSKREYKEK